MVHRFLLQVTSDNPKQTEFWTECRRKAHIRQKACTGGGRQRRKGLLAQAWQPLLCRTPRSPFSLWLLQATCRTPPLGSSDHWKEGKTGLSSAEYTPARLGKLAWDRNLGMHQPKSLGSLGQSSPHSAGLTTGAVAPESVLSAPKEKKETGTHTVEGLHSTGVLLGPVCSQFPQQQRLSGQLMS